MTEATGNAATGGAPVVPATDLALTEAFIAVVVIGAGLGAAADGSTIALLIAVAAAQALLAVAWVFGTVMPGRIGGLVIAAAAAAGSDVAVMARPHDRLGVLLPVLGLVVPAVFVHQLSRGAARVQVVASMGAVALLAVAEVGLASLLQIRHEFAPSGDTVAVTVVASVAFALAVGFVADQVIATPRFDADLPRGLVALVLSAVAGGALGAFLLRDQTHFGTGRAVFVGAALGALAGLLSVACSFVLHTTPTPSSVWVARLRPLVAALLPLAVLAPLAFLLCLAIRT